MKRKNKQIKLICILLIFLSCVSEQSEFVMEDINYREGMRSFVINLSNYARSYNHQFIIIPQNGVEIITKNAEPDGPLASEYINAINGIGQEDLFYGYDDDNEPTPEESKKYILSFLNTAKSHGLEILVIDYCSDKSYVDDSYTQSNLRNYISFAADSRELNSIPSYPLSIFGNNNSSVTNLAEAKNFLYLINADAYNTKQNFLDAIIPTNYDVVLIDLYFHGDIIFSKRDITSLKTKPDGGRRLVIAYMSIGEAEDYRYYWKNIWNFRPPSWLGDENPEWEGNFKVHYWEQEWQEIIYGNDDSYLKKIINAGFDGVYLDIIDAFEYFE